MTMEIPSRIYRPTKAMRIKAGVHRYKTEAGDDVIANGVQDGQQQMISSVQFRLPSPDYEESPSRTLAYIYDLGATTVPGFRKPVLIVLAGLQIVIGVLCMTAQAAALVIQIEKREHEGWLVNLSFYICAGFWCALFFILSGGLTVVAWRHQKLRHVQTAMMCAIFSAVFAVILTGFSAWAVYHDATYKTPPKTTDEPLKLDRTSALLLYQTSLSMGVSLLILSFLELPAGIWIAIACFISLNTSPTLRSGQLVKLPDPRINLPP